MWCFQPTTAVVLGSPLCLYPSISVVTSISIWSCPEFHRGLVAPLVSCSCFFRSFGRVSVSLEGSICFLACSRHMLWLPCLQSYGELVSEPSSHSITRAMAHTQLLPQLRLLRRWLKAVDEMWVRSEGYACKGVAAMWPVPQQHVWSDVLVLLRRSLPLLIPGFALKDV